MFLPSPPRHEEKDACNQSARKTPADVIRNSTSPLVKAQEAMFSVKSQSETGSINIRAAQSQSAHLANLWKKLK